MITEVEGRDTEGHFLVARKFMIHPNVKILCVVRLRLTRFENFELVEVTLVTHDDHSFCTMLATTTSQYCRVRVTQWMIGFAHHAKLVCWCTGRHEMQRHAGADNTNNKYN